MSKWIKINDNLINTSYILSIAIYGNKIVMTRQSSAHTYTERYELGSIDSANEKFQEIQNILCQGSRDQLLKEIDDLRQMIMYLPQVGSVYQTVKGDFEKKVETISGEH